MKDEARLVEIKERFRIANDEWAPIREEGDKNIRFASGDPWDPKDRRARDAAQRPCISLDELNQYYNQVINNIRQNPRSIKFTPQGNGANDDTAAWYADKARETEYRSHAQLTYITAFENCVQRNVGWARVVSKYARETLDDADPSAFDQELWMEPVVNPNMVVPDPLAKRPDHADMHYLFYVEEFAKDEFLRRWPAASITNFTTELMATASQWFKGGKVQVAEYWVKESVGDRSLLLLRAPAPTPDAPNPKPFAVWEDELEKTPSDEHIQNQRKVPQFKVTQYLTNGVEILSRTKWLGKYIPFVSCLGKVMYVDRGTGPERLILSLTDLARDPQMLYAYYCTTEAEIVGGIPKFPYFYYEGQLSPESLELLAKSLHEPVAGIPVKPIAGQSPAGQLLPPPARQPWDPPLQGIQLGKEAARRAIQAAMGVMPLPTQAQRRNEKSGVALQQIEKTEQIGSYHLSAHFDDMVRQIGVIFEDLADKVYDTARTTDTRDASDKTMQVRINDPAGSEVTNGQVTGGKPIFTKADHAVTVSSGPAADSQREAVAEFVGQLSQIPEVMQQCGDLIVRLQSKTMNLGPLMEELADRLTPPQFKQPADGQAPDPKQLMAQVQQLSQAGQQKDQAIAQLSMEIKTKVAEYQQQSQIEAMKEDKRAQLAITLAHINNAAKIEQARITASKQTADPQAEAAEEEIALGREHAFQADQAEKDRQHELTLAGLKHGAAMQQSDQAHQQGLEAGQQQHAQAVEQAQIPPPVDPNQPPAPPDQTGAGA